MPTATAMARHAPPQAVVLHLLLQIHLVMAGSFISSNNGDHTVAMEQHVVPCLHDQETALLRFKQSFAATADSITAFQSWKVGVDCCGWAGVHCGDADGRVTSLDLGNWGLESAGIGLALFNLTSLRHLDLSWNDFNMSELPSIGFERLTKLTTLNLANTNLSGQVPQNIGRLTNLVSLDLSVSTEIDEIPGVGYIVSAGMGDVGQLAMANFTSFLANLGSLRELDLGCVDLSQSSDWCDALAMYTPNLHVLKLSFCMISGPICRTLSSLHSLSVIDLHYNSLTGPVPNFFANHSFLSVLQLSYNYLEGWVSPDIFKLKKLVTIDLRHNPKISGSLPYISANSSLQNLLVGNTNFSGTIPSSIGKIQSLKRLCLDAPGLSGNLPSSIGELKALNTLKVSGLVGSIPSWITNLTSLEVLQFSHCGLYGPIPSSISHLIKLKTLAIMQCKASGRIPPHILNMTGLEELVLASNNFIGTVDLNSFWRLPNLSLLDLSNNKIVVLEGQDNSSMVSFPNIVYLKLASCNITKFPRILKHLDDINGIDLSNNQMHGAIPRWLWEKWSTNPNFGPRSGLFFLNFSHNQFTSVGYDTFLPVYSIKLDLSFNMLDGPIPLPRYYGTETFDYSSNMFSSIPHNLSTQLGNSYVFKASKNNFSGNIPTYFCVGLEFLDLSYNTFNGSIPSCLMEDANRLRVLNLKENQLDGEIPDNFNKTCTLKFLDISGNMIDGQLPRSLAACKRLEVLDIANNEITGSFPCWMSTLPRLQVVILKRNKFFGLVTPSSTKNKVACEFPSMRILDISFNSFSGMLNKEWFSKLTSMMVKVSNETLVMEYDAYQKEVYQVTTELTYKGSVIQFDKILRTLGFLDVSNNAFQGSIPTSIGDLVLLDVLNMSHNSFTGPIPSQFGHLTLLESLDLSSNELSGEIPLGLASLDSLATLDLSNNRLVGSIPESTHFSTFSNSSFLGNVGLCGPPLSKQCVNTTTTNVASHQSKKKSVDIILFLFAGVGFGVGFAIAVLWGCGISIRKQLS